MKLSRHGEFLECSVFARRKFVENIIRDVTGATAAKQANKLGGRSVKIQEEQYADLKAYFEKLAAQFSSLKQSGFFSPESRVASYDKDFNKGLDEALSTAATADRV